MELNTLGWALNLDTCFLKRSEITESSTRRATNITSCDKLVVLSAIVLYPEGTISQIGGDMMFNASDSSSGNRPGYGYLSGSLVFDSDSLLQENNCYRNAVKQDAACLACRVLLDTVALYRNWDCAWYSSSSSWNRNCAFVYTMGGKRVGYWGADSCSDFSSYRKDGYICEAHASLGRKSLVCLLS